MAAMASALTFGVELEFLMAFLPDDTPPPDPTKTRLLRFPYTPEDIKTYHGLTQDIHYCRHEERQGLFGVSIEHAPTPWFGG